MKRPPELSWQDKAILISLPVVVLVIFIVTNYLSQEPNVKDAFLAKKEDTNVRDAGRVKQIYPSVATSSVRVRLESFNDKSMQYDFVLGLTASETFHPEVGRLIQFYGKYKYDEKGGTITVPYKGKSGQNEGWAVCGENRYPSNPSGNQNPASSLPLPPQ